MEAALETWRATAPPALDSAGAHGRWIALLANTFPQWLEVWSGRVPAAHGWELGDRYMAENALAQLERLGRQTRPAFWAHNHHLWLEPWRAGSHLRRRLGSEYRVVYCAFGRGAYNASSQQRREGSNWFPHPAPPPPPGTLEHLLDAVGLDCFAVAPTHVPALRDELPVRHARMVVADGADQFSLRCVAADWIDLLVYFREAQPTRALGS